MVNKESLNKSEKGYVMLDQQTFSKFKRAYNATLKAKRQSFIFEGNEVLVDYAKYVIEHLTNKLNPKDR